MNSVLAAVPFALCSAVLPATFRVDVNSMPRVVFTGDSQTCGRVGAWDYPQMLSWELPVRVINTAVGGTNTRHLLEATAGGTAEVKAGEREVRGTKVSWHAGPYPGQKIRLGTQEYTIDRIVVQSYQDSASSIWLTQPAREDFSGTDYAIEPGWRVRIAQQRPEYVCLMYSVNDVGLTPEQFRANVRQMIARTRELDALPILLSGFPYIDKDRGGSHPGANSRVIARQQDLAAVAAEQSVPFGDVFGYLLAMDEQSTSVWVDTVHPTTDGSLPAMLALRHVFDELGVAANPYYVRGYRWSGDGPPAPDLAQLTPLSTSQPDTAADGSADDALFDLAAVEVRDEYGLLARADGRCVQSDVPVLLQFGIGDPDLIESAALEFAASSPTRLNVFDRQAGQWFALEPGGILNAARLKACCHRRALWALIAPESGTLQLDYVAAVLRGRMEPYAPQPRVGAVRWPGPELLSYEGGEGNLLSNGNLTSGDETTPAGWVATGPAAHYIRAGTVAQGAGEFIADRRVDLFRAPGQQFTRTARPLDMLQVSEAPQHAAGSFLVSQIVDDETLRVRRFPEAPVEGVRFELQRSSGCGAVPGGCAVQCARDASWATASAPLPAGSYRLSFFHRAHAPEKMSARSLPDCAGKVTVRLGEALVEHEFATSFVWQKHSLIVEVAEACGLTIAAQSTGAAAMEYTGFALTSGEK